MQFCSTNFFVVGSNLDTRQKNETYFRNSFSFSEALNNSLGLEIKILLFQKQVLLF